LHRLAEHRIGAGVLSYPIDHGSQSLRPGAVVRFTALAPTPHQSRERERGEVLRHHWLGNARVVRQGMHRVFSLTRQALENGAAGRIRQGLNSKSLVFCMN